MSDESTNNEPGFLDHLFNAFGHLAKAQRKQQTSEKGTDKKKTGSRGKFKAAAFDEAPSNVDECCIAKRGG